MSLKNNYTLAIIPARGNSQGIIDKNIKILGNKPLIYYSIKAAQGCRLINRVLVSTDSPKIADIAKKYGAWTPFLRPKKFSGHLASAASVINHTLSWLKTNNLPLPEIILYLQPTSPFRTSDQLTKALKKFKAQKRADTLISVGQVPHNFLPSKLMKLKKGFLTDYQSKPAKQPVNRQQTEILFARNGPAILIRKTSSFLKTQKIYGDKILPFIMSGYRDNLDINEEEDFHLGRLLIKNKIK
jgi:N-acylneuraminate cytidylyltransferase